MEIPRYLSTITDSMDLFTLAIIALLSSILYAVSRRDTLPYPPGPKGEFLLGFTRLSSLPSVKAWLTYLEWGKEFGNLIHFRRLGQHWIIINSIEVANEILEKRARFTSDRPFAPLDDLAGTDKQPALGPYGDEWRRARKVFHQNLRPEAANRYHPVQIEAIRTFLSDLVVSEEKLMDLISTLSLRIVFKFFYGFDITSNKDVFPRMGRELAESAGDILLPGWEAYKYIPFIHCVPSWLPSWFPGVKYQRNSEFLRRLADELIESSFGKAMDIDTSQCEGFLPLVHELATKTATEHELYIIKKVAFNSIIAASDTTMSAIGTFFIAMTFFPETQLKAQRELDSVIGPGKLPEFSDRSSLPYVEAIYREVMRWHPALPFGLPHRATEDIIFDGYCIPKGTHINANIWAMTHDPSVFENPDEFIPERHLRDDGSFDNITSILAYGFGRRVCVGRHMADATIWMTIASVLASMNITSVLKEGANNFEDYYLETTLCSPKSVPCEVKPRFPNMKYD